MYERIENAIKSIKKTGKNSGVLKVLLDIDAELSRVERDRSEADLKIEVLNSLREILLQPQVKIKSDYCFKAGYKPVVIFDNDEVTFAYKDSNEEYEEAEWPFDQNYITDEDCERLGIEFEVI
jgi:hypothetical protein